MSEEITRPNFYIFVSHDNNMQICFRHLIYGADISRPEHRALCNVKQGDIVFLYNMDRRAMYGPFLAEGRVFRDNTELGWSRTWPYRVPLKPWSSFVGILDRYKLQRVYSKIKRSLMTIRDLDDLHRRYLHPLLWDEGVILFEAFLEDAEFKRPRDISSDFGEDPLRHSPVESRPLPTTPREYQVELYLLQNYEKLGELVGHGFSEVYNQVYLYQSKFLDVLTIHRYGEKILKATVVEIKAKARRDDINKGLEELGHYMYTLTELLTGNPKKIYGILLTPNAGGSLYEIWRSKRKEVSEIYGLDEKRLEWIQYEVSGGDLKFL